MRILVIDDDDLARANIQQALTVRGHEVTTAEGRDALTLLSQVAWDLIVVDVLMPDVDGIEIIQAARRQEPGPRIIAISGGGRISAEQCLNLANAFGADAAFRKPVDLAALARSVVPAAER